MGKSTNKTIAMNDDQVLKQKDSHEHWYHQD